MRSCGDADEDQPQSARWSLRRSGGTAGGRTVILPSSSRSRTVAVNSRSARSLPLPSRWSRWPRLPPRSSVAARRPVDHFRIRHQAAARSRCTPWRSPSSPQSGADRGTPRAAPSSVVTHEHDRSYRGRPDDPSVPAFLRGSTRPCGKWARRRGDRRWPAGPYTVTIRAYDLTSRERLGEFATGPGGYLNRLHVHARQAMPGRDGRHASGSSGTSPRTARRPAPAHPPPVPLSPEIPYIGSPDTLREAGRRAERDAARGRQVRRRRALPHRSGPAGARSGPPS